MLLADEDVKEFYLGLHGDDGERSSFRDVKHYKRRKRGRRDHRDERREAYETSIQETQAVGVVTALLEVEDITLRFGGVTAISRVSFDVQPGELFAIIGPNGAGKTSIFNTISQVYKPQQGDIRFQGTSLMGLRPDKVAEFGIARTFQNIELFAQMNVVDNRGEEVCLCWRLGEVRIEFWHGVDEGFRGRKPIDEEFLANHKGDPD